MNARVLICYGMALSLAACTTTAPVRKPSQSDEQREGAPIFAEAVTAGKISYNDVSSLPVSESKAQFFPIVKKRLETLNLSPELESLAADRLAHYLSFLGIEVGSPTQNWMLKRLLSSSTEFLFCDFNDWACLEQKPRLQPSEAYRQEIDGKFGRPQLLADQELKMSYYFTQGWNPDVTLSGPRLVDRLAEKISMPWSRISMSLYGIDAIKETMSPVYNSLIEKSDQGRLRGIFDTNGFAKTMFMDPKTMEKPKPELFPVIFSYSAPTSEPKWAGRAGSWMFSEAPMSKVNPDAKPNPDFKPKERTKLDLQYTGTADLITHMNAKATSDNEIVARLEWPNRQKPAEIMHNKFFVFENSDTGQMSVWTGTANVARSCMGEEKAPARSNSNMAVYIENKEVAQQFLTEFEEMYQYKDEPLDLETSKIVTLDGKNQIRTGKFNKDKTPNTYRYFKFGKDGSELRLHFSPTDDAEHRVLIPLLLSAQRGDLIRISMFGGGGFEFVRAFQWAQAKGAQVQIVFDELTGACNFASWVTHEELNVDSENPYSASPEGKLDLRISRWKGMNHQKVATLTRRHASPSPHVETLVVGSQNWSQSGNDKNDENEMTIRNLKKDVEAGRAFNQHFDKDLWTHSMPLKEYKKLTGTCYEENQAKKNPQQQAFNPKADKGTSNNVNDKDPVTDDDDTP